MPQLLLLLGRKKGQATTELAIMGTVIVMVLGYLLQQGYIYNARQALEMYTFRKALELSRNEKRGIILTVMRDVIIPSFFTGLNRQRLMATSSVEYNPDILYIPYEEDPEDVPNRQLIQVGEAMIRKGSFFVVPPTKILVKSTKDEEPAKPMWTSSAISEFDTQTVPKNTSSNYNYTTMLSEASIPGFNTINKRNKKLEKSEKIPMIITFNNNTTLESDFKKEDWKNEITYVHAYPDTIPKNLNLTIEEKLRRQKNETTFQ